MLNRYECEQILYCDALRNWKLLPGLPKRNAGFVELSRQPFISAISSRISLRGWMRPVKWAVSTQKAANKIEQAYFINHAWSHCIIPFLGPLWFLPMILQSACCILPQESATCKLWRSALGHPTRAGGARWLLYGRNRGRVDGTAGKVLFWSNIRYGRVTVG